MTIRLIATLVALLAGLAFSSSLSADQTSDSEQIRQFLAPIAARADASPAREIAFTERRVFSFRKDPIEVEGIVRISKEHGISIAYPSEHKAMIIDTSGLTLRKFLDSGRTRDRHSKATDSELPHLLDALFRLDLDQLQASFDLALERDQTGSALLLTPKQSDSSKIERIRIVFETERPKSFLIDLAGKRRIEIEPTQERELPAFDEETLRLYFNLP